MTALSRRGLESVTRDVSNTRERFHSATPGFRYEIWVRVRVKVTSQHVSHILNWISLLAPIRRKNPMYIQYNESERECPLGFRAKDNAEIEDSGLGK